MAKTFPYLEVSGTHKDLGTAIGTRFKEKIQHRVTWQRSVVPKYGEIIMEQEPYFNAAREAFPDLIEELEATANASDVSVSDYFFINNRDLFDTSEDLVPEKKDPDRCTMAVSFNAEGAIIGHNEDWTTPVEDFLFEDFYVLKATINGTTFLGLQYAVELAGTGANMNNWGLVQSIVELMNEGQIGVPKNFISRAILECKTLDEAENIIVNTDRSSGFNHVLIQNHEVRNFEIAGMALAIQRVENKPFVHTNHYTSPEMSVFEEFHTKSSEARYRRAKELARNNMTEQDMIALLSDRTDEKLPICRHGVNFVNGKTVSGMVFSTNKKEVLISYDHPCAGEFTKYNL